MLRNCFWFEYGLKLNTFRPALTGVASHSKIADLSFFSGNLIHPPPQLYLHAGYLALDLRKFTEFQTLVSLGKKKKIQCESLFHDGNIHFKWLENSKVFDISQTYMYNFWNHKLLSLIWPRTYCQNRSSKKSCDVLRVFSTTVKGVWRM